MLARKIASFDLAYLAGRLCEHGWSLHGEALHPNDNFHVLVKLGEHIGTSRRKNPLSKYANEAWRIGTIRS